MLLHCAHLWNSNTAANHGSKLSELLGAARFGAEQTDAPPARIVHIS
jgi:hypothetical protein